jgi:hypothetical protein
MTEPSNVYNVTLQMNKLKPGQIHQTMKVWLGDPDTSDAELLLSASPDPEFEVCRLLQKRGLTGKLRTRWRGANHYAMTMGIDWGAKRSTHGGNKTALHIGEYVPADFGWFKDEKSAET